MLRHTVLAVGLSVLVILLTVNLSGFLLFTRAEADPLRPVDAIVVLGGEHDGREDFGIQLAHSGWAATVLLSDPYPADDSVMRRVCTPPAGIEVLCRRPVPATTRGEALLARQLANERSWRTIIVVSWRYHLPRARLLFGQCFSDRPDALVMQAPPRRYDFSLVRWQYIYTYQYAGLVKAVSQGRCP